MSTHPNAAVLRRLFTSLDRHDDAAIAECYAPTATFRDIAFDLHGKDRIHGMWQMICRGDIKVTIESVEADDLTGRARIVDEYTFSDTGRRVRNVIETRVRFDNGLIVEHRDECDPRRWASMALGGVSGWIAGRSRFLRQKKAHGKLERFLEGASHAAVTTHA